MTNDRPAVVVGSGPLDAIAARRLVENRFKVSFGQTTPEAQMMSFGNYPEMRHGMNTIRPRKTTWASVIGPLKNRYVEKTFFVACNHNYKRLVDKQLNNRFLVG
ncbi:MAG: hypothetical protein P8I27_18575 [Pirellulaceae bacterium]|nr:hypothetical protein [Pirellulaceae bacterium]MDG1809908.1 hypothetical protein [Pirellulaceae bacterium]